MKKHAIALAIVAAATAPALALADGPTLYGKINVTLDKVETDTGAAATSTDIWSLNSNASRIGVKGEADTGFADVKGIYVAEFGTYADDGDEKGQVFSQRNIYAGLKGGFGTIRAGKIDTPLKDAQGRVDQFNDLAADITNLLPGETRADNLVYYTSPKIAGALALNIAVAPGEGKDLDNADNDATTTTAVEDGPADYLSASIVYEKDALYAALSIAQNNSGSSNNDNYVDIDGGTTGTQSVADITRAVVTWKADSFELGALYQVSEDVGDTTSPVGEDAAWLLSGAYKYDKWKLKAQYGTNEGDVTARERTVTALGADYAIGKSTTVFGYWAEVDNSPVAATRPVTTTLALGIDQKF